MVLEWTTVYSWCATPLSLGDSPASLRASRSGVDDGVRRTWRPPFFVEKLLSEMPYQGDRGTWCDPWRHSFYDKSRGPWKRLGGEEAILLLSASITWTRGGLVPTDTIWWILVSGVCFPLHPFLDVFAFYSCNLYDFIFLEEHQVRLAIYMLQKVFWD